MHGDRGRVMVDRYINTAPDCKLYSCACSTAAREVIDEYFTLNHAFPSNLVILLVSA